MFDDLNFTKTVIAKIRAPHHIYFAVHRAAARCKTSGRTRDAGADGACSIAPCSIFTWKFRRRKNSDIAAQVHKVPAVASNSRRVKSRRRLPSFTRQIPSTHSMIFSSRFCTCGFVGEMAAGCWLEAVAVPPACGGVGGILSFRGTSGVNNDTSRDSAGVDTRFCGGADSAGVQILRGCRFCGGGANGNRLFSYVFF